MVEKPNPIRLVTYSIISLRDGLLQLLPFDSLHLRVESGVPETCYLVRFTGRRWLFPADIRNYDFEALQSFGGLNRVIAHL